MKDADKNNFLIVVYGLKPNIQILEKSTSEYDFYKPSNYTYENDLVYVPAIFSSATEK